jgi:hypothetical protein
MATCFIICISAYFLGGAYGAMKYPAPCAEIMPTMSFFFYLFFFVPIALSRAL